jgi:histidine transport system permease protein
MAMGFEKIAPYLPRILEGALLTVELALASLFLSIVFGLIGALMKTSSNPMARYAASTYSTVVRGIPELVWIVFVYYGLQIIINSLADSLGVLPIELNPFTAGTITLAFIYGAYFTETFRGAIMAIPAGQLETGRAYGMSSWQVFTRITFPQLMRYALPGIRNNWLVLVKATALASAIQLDDMTRIAKQSGQSEGASFAFNVTCAILFLIITSLSFMVFRRLERRYNRGLRGFNYGK